MHRYILQATYPCSVRITPASKLTEHLFGLAPSGVYLAARVTTNAVRSYRTISPLLFKEKRYLSAALAVGFHRPDVIWHSTLWSPDFPPLINTKALISGDCLVDSRAQSTGKKPKTQYTATFESRITAVIYTSHQY